MPRLLPLLALGALAACAHVSEDDLRYDNVSQDVRRAFQESFQTLPFKEGAVHVIAPERSGLQTFTLVPCRGGAAICAGTTGGRAGRVSRGAEFYDVTGTYPGVSFHLSPGGDGYMVDHGRYIPVAWN